LELSEVVFRVDERARHHHRAFDPALQVFAAVTRDYYWSRYRVNLDR
jgi:hypothetical protein